MKNVSITNLIIILVLYILVLVLAELLYKSKVPPYVSRKIAHICGSLVAALMPALINPQSAIVIGISFFFLLLLSKKFKLLRGVHDGSVSSVGAFVYPLIILLLAIIFWPINKLMFIGAVLVLGISDGMAGIIGTKYGSIKINFTGHKTLEGSITFFVATCMILCLLVFNVYGFSFVMLAIILGSSLLITLIEALFGKGWDNVFVPLLTGIILYFLL